MNPHEQIVDDLPLYALGALEGEERLVVERHLEECSACHRELEQLRGDAALLAISASGPKPPMRSRERLMAAIAREPRSATQGHSRKRGTWWDRLEWMVAAAALVIMVLLLHQNSNLRRRVAEVEVNSREQDQQLLEAKQLLATLTSPDAEHFTLVAGKVPPQPQGKAIYVRSSGMLVFLASNIPALPPQKTYELWLIPTTGAPIPAGLFKPDARGTAVVVKPLLPTGVEAKTFAITVEPETGSPAPTSQPIMVGIRG
ncbi:MAG TPA: anti-sigma factor [Terriglobales bacterium]|nr:anti-sigma factor [Terriglobales bacterium]